MSECEANKQALAHWIFSISHLLQSSLLVMNLLILRHISLVAEVIEVASVGLGIKLGDERGALSSKGVPIDFGEILVSVDILDRGKPLRLGGNASIEIRT